MFTFWMALLANILGTAVLVYVVYFRRHHRRDLALAYVALSMGIFAVTLLLTTSDAGMGLGLGLFGILSIIRLRSNTLTQEEVAYYFVSLAIGLVNGLHPDPAWLAPTITAALLVVMFAADHPRFAATTTRQVVTMDTAYPRRAEMDATLEQLLGARILRTVVLELDMVRDTTVVDVRFRELPAKTSRRARDTVAEPVPRQETTGASAPAAAEREYATQGQGSK
ncbi:MAG: DUF4956 domain-containing protein [Arthrobacter sp.]|uniref:DUF4956 domain-containing protein n=1 Tax=unclassified Arthrobacter TaxID=235627 RepID=UPI00264C5025|nr:DUF4956 domain-containing protein [Micrococcaceae bacterium]MDN6168983.1 DUF4956 domain-containing protein [Micrococcaceae bacterium]MDN6178200.1 DUF4956 domain-containing protein [Micrococcaceae bacterium]